MKKNVIVVEEVPHVKETKITIRNGKIVVLKPLNK